MTASAVEIANALLRLGVLDPDDADQRTIREQLIAEPALYDEVKQRLEGVGYDLVQFLGHIGTRLQRATERDPLVSTRNNRGLDARHVRVLVYLWIQLLFRQITQAMRDQDVEPMGRDQTLFSLDDSDETPALPHSELESEFNDIYSRATLKAIITILKRNRFVVQDGGEGTLRAGPAMYILIDHERMEEFVVGLARRGAIELPEKGSSDAL